MELAQGWGTNTGPLKALRFRPTIGIRLVRLPVINL
jgi:hypothetical protein